MTKSKFFKGKMSLLSQKIRKTKHKSWLKLSESHHSESRVSTLSSHPLRPEELEDPQTKQTGSLVIKSHERNVFKDPEKVQNTL